MRNSSRVRACLRLLKISLLTATACSLSTLTLKAQKDTVTLNDAQVRSSSYRQNRSDLGRNTTYIDGKVLQQLPVVHWDDLLKHLPGLEVQQRGGFGSQADITLRGGTFQQVLILVDGIRINDPLTGHFNGNIPVVPAEIDHIEVIKGPAAMNFGPEAVGGVIHIITKAYGGRAFWPGKKFSGSITGGEWNFLGVQAFASATDKKLRNYFSASYMRNSSPGQLLSGDSIRGNFSNNIAAISHTGKWGRNIVSSTRVSSSFYDFNARFFYTRSTADKSQEWIRRFSAQHTTKINHQGNRRTTDLQAAVQRTTDSFLFNPAFKGNHHIMWLWQAGATHYVRLSPNSNQWNWNTGFQYFGRDIQSSDRGNHREHEAALWSQMYYKGQKTPLNINAGIRLTLDALNRLNLTPQINANYRLGAVSIRGGFSRSFRNPDFTERYVSTGLPGVLTAGRNLGNPLLKPEFAWNYEAGFDYSAGRHFTKQFTFRSTAFLRRSNNLIDFMYIKGAYIPPNAQIDTGRSYFYAQNLTPLNTAGFEADVQWTGTIYRTWKAMVMGGITALRFSNNGSSTGISKYVASNAGFLANAQLILQRRQFFLGVNGVWKQRTEETALVINKEISRSYLVMNGNLSWNRPDNRLNLRLQCMNLGNLRYSDIMGAELPRRWWMLGIGISL
ncbi:MAG: TonB-dependent receptor [Bacteroidetes bacterium]|nr:TonB-dependent receptor [Bacteroidota bacterium]